jgi:hypothetical protein
MSADTKIKGWPRQVPDGWREAYLPKDPSIFCYFERHVSPLRLVVSHSDYAGWQSSVWYQNQSLWDRSQDHKTALEAIRKAESMARKCGYRP